MKRIQYIDILRAIAIILVIIGHIPYPDFNAELHKWIYSFHIPLFFFVSGISLSFTNYQKLNLKTILKKRFIHICSPYFIWTIVLALPNISLMTIPKILYGTHQSIGSVSNSSLWFLPVLFLATVLLDFILYFFYKRKLIKYLPITLATLLFIVIFIPSQANIQSILMGHNLPFGLDIVPMASLFMLAGYLFSNHQKNRKNKLSITIALPLIILLFIATTYFSLHNDVNYVLMAENRYGNYLFFFATTILGITASVLAAITIANYTKWLSKLMQIIGSNTMVLFILHKYPLTLINDLILLISVAHISNYIIVPLYLFFTLITCVPVASFIKKHAPFLIGKTS